jgi:hypothetical protein
MWCEDIDKYSYYGYNIIMRTVGVRDLKDQLSLYLRLVKGGETVYVKEHNRIIAELTLPKIYENVDEEIINYIDKKALEGKIVKARRKSTIIQEVPKNNINNDWINIYTESKEDRF